VAESTPPTSATPKLEDPGQQDEMAPLSPSAAKPDLQGQLTKRERMYDLNRDGQLDVVEKTIMKYDNGDGNFSLTEVKAIITDLKAKEEEQKHTQKIATALFVALLAVCVMNFLSTMWGISLMKDVEQRESGVMTVAGTNTVVQVASSDMAIGPDGSLVAREGSGVVVTGTNNESGVRWNTAVTNLGAALASPDMTPVCVFLGSTARCHVQPDSSRSQVLAGHPERHRAAPPHLRLRRHLPCNGRQPLACLPRPSCRNRARATSTTPLP